MDLSNVPISPDEHYLVKHPTDWYQCLKCQQTGQNIKDKPCPVKHHGNRKGPVTNQKPVTEEKPVAEEKPVKKDRETEEKESILQALLEEELVLAQLLEEAMTESEGNARTQEQADLDKAIAMSLDTPPPTNAQETNPGEDLEKELEKAFACPEAAREEMSQLCSEQNLYKMQCLIDMGYNKEQAIWGVKRSNDGNGSIELAREHAYWRYQADELLQKRRKLELMTQSAPKPGTPCTVLRSFSVPCMDHGLMNLSNFPGLNPLLDSLHSR